MAYSLLLNGCLASIVGQRRAEQKFRSALFQKNQAMPRSRNEKSRKSETKKFDDVISRTRAL
ncbi:hypothetical protein T02_4411 [Trichinella nativa]|uniref:Uncharacterized protein n=1 Tax=Trichinella nativa TaxID=6335 RepID=A0A0V1LJ81_9BILA|nr:hypothetical protein T02_4411 [Trichinella nativa]